MAGANYTLVYFDTEKSIANWKYHIAKSGKILCGKRIDASDWIDAVGNRTLQDILKFPLVCKHCRKKAEKKLFG